MGLVLSFYRLVNMLRCCLQTRQHGRASERRPFAPQVDSGFLGCQEISDGDGLNRQTLVTCIAASHGQPQACSPCVGLPRSCRRFQAASIDVSDVQPSNSALLVASR